MNFLFPAFIAASVALAIPVVLHLVNRELPKTRYFPSIRFIRRGRIVHHGRSGLKDILLLLLRLAALSLLILAFAHPFIPISEPKSPTNREVIIYCDVTPSVPLDKLKQTATNLVNSYSDKGYKVGLSICPSKEVTIPPTNKSLLLTKIAALKSSTLTGGHQVKIGQTIDTFTPQATKELVVLSDFQTGEWHEELFAHLKFEGILKLKKLTPELRRNLAILSTTVRKHAKQTLVSCLIRNYMPEVAKGKLQLTTSLAKQTADFEIAPLKSAHIQVVADGDFGGIGELELLHKDEMAFDNHYKVWLGAQAPIKVLLVEPLAPSVANKNEIFFLSKALSVQTSGSRKVLVNTIDVKKLETQSLNYYDAICMCGAGGFLSEKSFDNIMTYIRKGGTLMSTPGKKFATFNLKLNNKKIAKLAFARKISRSKIDGYHSFSAINKDDPLFSIFTKVHRSEWMMTRIFSFNQLKLESNINVLAEIDDKFPAFMQLPLGKGRFYLWSFPLDNEASDLPLSALYLPLIRHLIESSRKAEGIIKLNCGDLFPSISVNKTKDLPNTEKPGLGFFEKTPYQINISPRESIPTSLTEFQLKNFSTHIAKDKTRSHTHRPTREGGKSLTLWLALLALIFLFISYEFETERTVKTPTPTQ